MFSKTSKQIATSPEDQFVIDRLKNITNTAEGTNLPPSLRGGVRVPIVTGLKLNKITLFNSNTSIQYIISWNDAQIENVDHYNIYLRNTKDPTGVVNSPFMVKNSPALVLTPVSLNLNSRNIITIQTVLNNGLMSSLEDSPSVAAGFTNYP